jgi:hypothetical protein
MILFALMAVAAGGMTLTNAPAVEPAKGTAILFGALFLISAVAQALRGRAE